MSAPGPTTVVVRPPRGMSKMAKPRLLMRRTPSNAVSRRWTLALCATALTAAAFAFAPKVAQAQNAMVTLDHARAEAEAGRALLVDIREPDEPATGVAPGARLVPMRQLSVRLADLPKDRPVLLICNTQNRSRATYDALRQQGYTNLQYVVGGMSEWTRRSWPLVAPAKEAQPPVAAR